jgi:hypothetical protein
MPNMIENYPRAYAECKRIVKRLIEVLKGVGFTGNKSDPCLLSKWDEKESF